MSGTVYGLGVGPGDPELVTLKALRIARACPVIAYPAPEHGDSLARAIMAPHLPGGQREIAIRMPLVAERFPARDVYDAAARDIAAELAQERDVAVFCLGDPFLYGSFLYLFARLGERHRVRVVPGVASPMAAAAALGWPLAARNDILSIIPAPLDDVRLAAALAGAEAAAIIKLGRHFARVRALLERLGRAADARYIAHASMANEHAAPLDAVDAAAVPYFSLILVHAPASAARAALG